MLRKNDALASALFASLEAQRNRKPAESVPRPARNLVHKLNSQVTISETRAVLDYPPGGFMDILKALRQEEAKFLKQLDSARQQLETIRSAIKMLGGKATGTKKRFVSRAARAKMAKAQKERWRKVKAAKKSGS